jgi:hypothetical protein
VTTPPRPDQAIDPPAAVLAPGGAAGVFRGRLVVISGSSTNGSTGLFVYSPSPGAGNLVTSIAALAGTDPYGNAYLQGTVNYALVSGTTWLAAALLGGQLQWWVSTTGQAGPYTENLAIGAAGSTDQYFVSTATFVGLGTPAVAAPDPGISSPVTPESWHNLALVNGWTGTFRYQLLADGRVEVDVNISSAAATAFVCGTMPANYIPANTVYLAAGSTGNVSSSLAPFLQVIASTGNVTMNGLHAFSTAGQWVAGGSYPLT